MTSGAATADRERLAWPDATRGLAVLAVVIYHSLIWNHRELAGPLNPAWGFLNEGLSQLRMPVLLALSGLLAAPALARGWRGGAAVRRFVANYWLYLLWVLIYFVFYVALSEPDVPNSVQSAGQLARQVVLADTTLWYLLALAVFPVLVLGAQLARIRPWMVLAIALAMRLVGSTVDMPDAIGKPVRTFLFFVVGVYLAPQLWRLAKLKLWWMPVFLALYLALVVVLVETPPSPADAALTLVASLASIPAAITVMVAASRIPAVAAAGAAIGARTLPIYLVHPLVLAAVLVVGRRVQAVQDFAQSAVGDYLMPLGSAALAVVVALAVHTAARRIPGNPLFKVPARLDRAALAVAAGGGPGRHGSTSVRRW